MMSADASASTGNASVSASVSVNENERERASVSENRGRGPVRSRRSVVKKEWNCRRRGSGAAGSERVKTQQRPGQRRVRTAIG